MAAGDVEDGFPMRFAVGGRLLVDDGAVGPILDGGGETFVARLAQGRSDQIANPKDGHGESAELRAALGFGCWRAVVERLKDEEAALGTLLLSEAQRGGGHDFAGVAGLLQGASPAGLGENVEAKGGGVSLQRFEVKDGKIFRTRRGRNEGGLVLFLGEMEIREAFVVSALFPRGPSITRHAGVPSEGLEFGLAGEGAGDKSPKFPPADLAAGLIEGGDGVEHFHGAHDLSAQDFGAFLGDLLNLLLGFARVSQSRKRPATSTERSTPAASARMAGNLRGGVAEMGMEWTGRGSNRGASGGAVEGFFGG